MFFSDIIPSDDYVLNYRQKDFTHPPTSGLNYKILRKHAWLRVW
jgi:hypothetical protein